MRAKSTVPRIIFKISGATKPKVKVGLACSKWYMSENLGGKGQKAGKLNISVRTKTYKRNTYTT